MARSEAADTIDVLRAMAMPLSSADASRDEDVDVIVSRLGDARVVLIGEASHGTHEFYAVRAAVTRRLIERHGFNAVAIEGDWPDSRRVDRFVRGSSEDADASAALGGFRRFPQWMWRNHLVQGFVDWMRGHNAGQPPDRRCGFYGLDLYSLHGSIDAVLRYLERVDPRAALRARERYSCFEAVGGNDPQAYGYAATRQPAEACEEEVVRQLAELRHCVDEYASGGSESEEEFFSAEQNARLVANAERYYRAMFRGRTSSWNLRDTHMAETLEAVVDRLGRGGSIARVCVWAHNSHLGDARATSMGRGGEVNLGQLARQRYGDKVRVVGFSTYTGSVTAAHDWDEPARRRWVRPALAGSIEALLHRVGVPNFLLDLRAPRVRELLAEPLLERAIGVIYRPETERMSHYFEASPSRQFDLLVHLDETKALAPLECGAGWNAGEERGELPETYPSAL